MTDYEQLARATVGDNILGQITQTAREIRDQKELIEKMEKALAEEKRKLELLEKETLPELMKDAGQEQCTTSDGYIVSIKDMTRGQPSKENEAAAYMWLRRNGHGGIIKAQIVADLGKCDDKLAKKALAALQKAGISTARAKETVHWQTLGALVRELLAEGVNVPLQTLGIQMWKQADVKPKT